MDLEILEKNISTLKQNIEMVEQIISDYKTCQSAISKKVLEAAITKYSANLFQKTEQ